MPCSLITALSSQSYCALVDPEEHARGVFIFTCGLAISGSMGQEEITDTVAVELQVAHERHHQQHHPRHGEEWALITESTPDGLVVYCPEPAAVQVDE